MTGCRAAMSTCVGFTGSPPGELDDPNGFVVGERESMALASGWNTRHHFSDEAAAAVDQGTKHQWN